MINRRPHCLTPIWLVIHVGVVAALASLVVLNVSCKINFRHTNREFVQPDSYLSQIEAPASKLNSDLFSKARFINYDHLQSKSSGALSSASRSISSDAMSNQINKLAPMGARSFKQKRHKSAMRQLKKLKQQARKFSGFKSARALSRIVRQTETSDCNCTKQLDAALAQRLLALGRDLAREKSREFGNNRSSNERNREVERERGASFKTKLGPLEFSQSFGDRERGADEVKNRVEQLAVRVVDQVSRLANLTNAAQSAMSAGDDNEETETGQDSDEIGTSAADSTEAPTSAPNGTIVAGPGGSARSSMNPIDSIRGALSNRLSSLRPGARPSARPSERPSKRPSVRPSEEPSDEPVDDEGETPAPAMDKIQPTTEIVNEVSNTAADAIDPGATKAGQKIDKNTQAIFKKPPPADTSDDEDGDDSEPAPRQSGAGQSILDRVTGGQGGDLVNRVTGAGQAAVEEVQNGLGSNSEQSASDGNQENSNQAQETGSNQDSDEPKPKERKKKKKRPSSKMGLQTTLPPTQRPGPFPPVLPNGQNRFAVGQTPIRSTNPFQAPQVRPTTVQPQSTSQLQAGDLKFGQACNKNVADLRDVLTKLMFQLDRFMQNLTNDRSVSVGTHRFISGRVQSIRNASNEAIIASKVANLRSLTKNARSASLEAIRLTKDSLVNRSDPSLKSLAELVRKTFVSYRRACQNSR